MPGKTFITNYYQWYTTNTERFWQAQADLIGAVRNERGVFASDALIVWGRNLGFLDDERLTKAWDTHAHERHERGILWRTASLAWALRQAIRLDGDIVECGCYAGTTMRILLDAVDVGSRPVFLYDLFDHQAGMAHQHLPEHGEGLFEQVQARFPEPNVQVIRGMLPESFKQAAPERVAFAHIDLNNAPGEIAALDYLESRFVTGAVIVFDDFGQLPYEKQHVAEREWFSQRGRPILESPTGQGIVIW